MFLIAIEIIHGNAKHTYALMDRDNSVVKRNTFGQPNIFYTHGYSWENDVFAPEVICDTIISLAGINNCDLDPQTISNALMEFSKKVRPAVIFDVALAQKNSSFIPKSPTGCGLIDNTYGTVNKNILSSLVLKRRDEILSHALVLLIKKKLMFFAMFMGIYTAITVT